MSRKIVKKSKNTRENVKVRKTAKKKNSYRLAFLLVPVLVLVALGSFFVFMQVNNKAYAASSITPKNCTNVSFYSNSNVSSFVSSYQKGKSAKLTAYLECGTPPAWTEMIYRFIITTSNHKLQVALEHYMDAQPPSPTTHPNATLTVVNSTTANFNCSNGKFVFNLYK